ncbi:hypothetical protein D3C72_1847320 [compost metagenome]
MAAVLVGDFETHTGKRPLGKHLIVAQWPGFELDGDTVAAEPVQCLRIALGHGAQLAARVAPQALVTDPQADESQTCHQAQVQRSIFLVHDLSPFPYCAGAVVGGASSLTRSSPHSPEALP